MTKNNTSISKRLHQRSYDQKLQSRATKRRHSLKSVRIENLVNEAYIIWLDGEEHESQSSQIEAHLQQFVEARKANGAQIRGQLNHIKVGITWSPKLSFVPWPQQKILSTC